MIYVITGATGHIGRVIAEQLLWHGRQVRAVSRHAAGLAPLVAQGAEACPGSLDDPAFLTRTCKGAAALFALIPPQPQAPDYRAFQNRVGQAMAEAVQAAGVRYVVNLSSQGAQWSEGTGPIAGLYDQEQRWQRLPGLHAIHLRPAFFMENLLANLDLIRRQGINGTPLRGDLAFPMIATRDIAHAAVKLLAALSFTGQTVCDLLGQRDLTMPEATRVLGQAIGKPDLLYVQFAYEGARRAMLALGLSPDVARLYIEMYQAFNAGQITQGTPRTPNNTTSTPIEEFARDFARAYEQHGQDSGKPASLHRP